MKFVTRNTPNIIKDITKKLKRSKKPTKETKQTIELILAQPPVRSDSFSENGFYTPPQRLFMNYFLTELKPTNAVKEKELEHLIIADYILRFEKINVNKNLFTLIEDKDKTMEFLERNLTNRHFKDFNTKNGNKNFRSSVKQNIAANQYLSLFRNIKPHLTQLIHKSKDKNDLKAIYMLDVIFPSLNKKVFEELVGSNLNPEQIYLESLKIRQTSNAFESLSDAIKSSLPADLTKKSAKHISDLKTKVEQYAQNLYYFEETKCYPRVTEKLRKKKDEILDTVNNYIQEKTNNILSSIDPNFALSDNLQYDMSVAMQNTENLRTVKKHYAWFGLDLSEVNNAEEQAKSRNEYFRGINYINDQLTHGLTEIQTLEVTLSKKSLDTVTKSSVDEMTKIERDLQKHCQDFNAWVDDHYVGQKAKQFHTKAQECLENITNKTAGAFEKANKLLASLDHAVDPNLETEIEALYEDKKNLDYVKSVYAWFKQSNPEITNAESQLEKREKYLNEILDLQLRIDEKIEEVKSLCSEIEKITSENMDKDSVEYLESSKKELEMKKDLFKQWKNDFYVKSDVQEFNDLAIELLSDISKKINDKKHETQQLLNSIDPYESLSGDIDSDEGSNTTKLNNLEKVKEVFSWFNLENYDVEEKEKRLVQRRDDFTFARSKMKDIEVEKHDIQDYKNSLSGLNYHSSLGRIKELAKKKTQYDQILHEYKRVQKHDYICEKVKELQKEIKDAKGSINAKTKIIITEAKEVFKQADPAKNKFVNLEYSIEQVKKQKRLYQKAASLYNALGLKHDNQNIHKYLVDLHKALVAVKDAWNDYRQRRVQAARYPDKVFSYMADKQGDDFTYKALNKHSVEQINKQLEELDELSTLSIHSKSTIFKPFSIISKSTADLEGIAQKTRAKIYNMLDERAKRINEAIEAKTNEIETYNAKKGFGKFIESISPSSYLNRRSIKSDLDRLQDELECLEKVEGQR